MREIILNILNRFAGINTISCSSNETHNSYSVSNAAGESLSLVIAKSDVNDLPTYETESGAYPTTAELKSAFNSIEGDRKIAVPNYGNELFFKHNFSENSYMELKLVIEDGVTLQDQLPDLVSSYLS